MWSLTLVGNQPTIVAWTCTLDTAVFHLSEFSLKSTATWILSCLYRHTCDPANYRKCGMSASYMHCWKSFREAPWNLQNWQWRTTVFCHLTNQYGAGYKWVILIWKGCWLMMSSNCIGGRCTMHTSTSGGQCLLKAWVPLPDFFFY